MHDEQDDGQQRPPSQNKSLTEKERSVSRNALMPEGFVEVFESRHTIMILLFLEKEGPCSKSELYAAVSRNPNMPRKIELLEEHGLISRRPVLGKYQESLSITDKGREFVDRIRELESILEQAQQNGAGRRR
ncbi:MAG: hypothetical protein IJ856_00670 [Candidatus Methanomethylophilaceae archaeon]|nr:hypothetical protein [Candidatus Methanomethylophilaceae archaeon]